MASCMYVCVVLNVLKLLHIGSQYGFRTVKTINSSLQYIKIQYFNKSAFDFNVVSYSMEYLCFVKFVAH